MAECEICGRESSLYTVEIDRAKLRVCFDCSKSGKLIESPKPQFKQKQQPYAPATKPHATEFELIADYGSKVKSARERMHITRNVLAEMINEKESFLERVEAEKAPPTESLARRLERALGISLYEEVGVGSSPGSKTEKRGLTLGDVIRVKKKEKEEEETD
jgi:uncharacterized protein (TIGR00270 family)